MTQGKLAEKFEELRTQNRAKPCTAGRLVNSLDVEDQEAFKALLDSDVSVAQITMLLKEHGYQISDNVLWRHRTRRCLCEGNA